MHSAVVAKEGSENFEIGSERTLYPYVTGTSVIGIKYRDGILMTADMGGSYGSTLRYKSVERLKPVGKHSLLGASGEISDFQEILCYLDELILYDNMWDDGNSLGPKEVHNYLNRVMYNRRNKFNPLWNSLVLGGVKNGQKYLGTVSMIGVHFEDNHVATGFGNHLARPILRDEWHEDMSFEEAVKLLEKCMLVLLYRDRSAINKLQQQMQPGSLLVRHGSLDLAVLNPFKVALNIYKHHPTNDDISSEERRLRGQSLEANRSPNARWLTVGLAPVKDLAAL